MGPLKELSRVQYMSYANVSEGEHHLPHTPGLPVGIVVTRHNFSCAKAVKIVFQGIPGQEHPKPPGLCELRCCAANSSGPNRQLGIKVLGDGEAPWYPLCAEPLAAPAHQVHIHVEHR